MIIIIIQKPIAKMEYISVQADRIDKIKNQCLSIYKGLIGKFKLKQMDNLNYSYMKLLLFHKNNYQQTIRISFPQKYPSQPFKIDLEQSDIPEVFIHSKLLDKKNWTSDTKLCSVLIQVFDQIEMFWKNQNEIQKQQKSKDVAISESVSKKQRKSIEHTNHLSSNDTSQTKNLNRHFKSKLKQILYEVRCKKQKDFEIDDQDFKFVEHCFNKSNTSFVEIRDALKNKTFNRIVQKYLDQSRFFHKIITGNMGIKSKKLMVKYYHIMVLAVHNPDEFRQWKYD